MIMISPLKPILGFEWWNPEFVDGLAGVSCAFAWALLITGVALYVFSYINKHAYINKNKNIK